MESEDTKKNKPPKIRDLLKLPIPRPKPKPAREDPPLLTYEESGSYSAAGQKSNKEHVLTYRQVAVLTTFLTIGTLIQGLLSRGFGLTLACMINATAIHDMSQSPVKATHLSDGTGISPNESLVLISSNCGRDPHYLKPADLHPNLGYTGTFAWDSIQQANVVAVYSWGSLIILPFSGFFISLVDARQSVSVALAIIGVTMGLFPVVTMAGGFGGAVFMRLIMGFSYAIISPSMDKVIATYTPWGIRNVLYTIITAGSFISVVIGNSVGGLLCTSDIFGGWPAIYYIAAICAGLWLIAWETYLVVVPYCIEKYNPTVPYTPPPRKTVPPPLPDARELRTRLRETAQNALRKVSSFVRRFWRDVGHRMALWAMIPSVFAATCTTNLLMNYIPTFYRDVFQISLKNNGVYTSLPFIGMLFGSVGFSSVADALKNRKSGCHFPCPCEMTPDRVSKILNTVGLCGSGLFIVLVTFIECLSDGAAVTLLTLSALLYSGVFPGYRVGIVTLSPKWAAVISAIITMASVIAGIIFPYLQGSIVRHGTAHEWHNLFITIVSIDVVASLVYLSFGSVTTHDPAPYQSITVTTDTPSAATAANNPHQEEDVGIVDASDVTERTPLLDSRPKR